MLTKKSAPIGTEGYLGQWSLRETTKERLVSSTQFDNTLTPAFKCLPKIEHLSLSNLPQSYLNEILVEGLSDAAKSLELCVCLDPLELPIFQGLTNVLVLGFEHCLSTNFPVLLAAINEDRFQHLHTLRARCTVGRSSAYQLLQAILNWKLPSIEHLDLYDNSIGDEAIDLLIEAIPLLASLDLEGNQFITAGKARLREAVERYLRLTINL